MARTAPCILPCRFRPDERSYSGWMVLPALHALQVRADRWPSLGRMARPGHRAVHVLVDRQPHSGWMALLKHSAMHVRMDEGSSLGRTGPPAIRALRVRASGRSYLGWSRLHALCAMWVLADGRSGLGRSGLPVTPDTVLDQTQPDLPSRQISHGMVCG